MIFQYFWLFLQFLAFSFLISCRPSNKIKDIRTLNASSNSHFESYFSLLKVKSPCTVFNDNRNSQSLSLTSHLVVKKNHQSAILSLKKKLPKPITTKINNIRNYKKSTYYQYEYLVHGKKVCGQFLRIRFDESGKMNVVGNINKNISIKSAYEWGNIDLSVIEKSKKIEDLNVKEIVLVSSDDCLQEKDGELLAISKLELFSA